MSGHSKWSTIKRAKGAADVKRSNTFTKLANAITIATKLGGSADPDSNPRLRMAVDEARTANMPKDNIQRAIDRGSGKLGGAEMEELFYEGFGPSKVAFIVEVVTDNKNRTLAEMKNLFDRAGGALGNTGSVSYMFDRVGEIRVQGKGGSSDEELLELIDTGALDVEDFEEDGVQKYLIYTAVTELNNVSTKVTQLGFKIESNGLIFKPNMSVEISDQAEAERVVEFAEKIENHDDVQKVFANFNIPDNLI